MAIPSASCQEGLVNGVKNRGPVLDRSMPSGRRRRGRSSMANLKSGLVVHKRKLRAALVASVLVTAVAFTFVSALGPSSAADSHDPIYIDSYDDFTFENGVRTGSGEEGNPFVINDWAIVGDSSSPGIHIWFTTAYFVIRDVTITACTHGVRLDEVSNGEVRNNVISDISGPGIYVYYGTGMRIDSNDISGCLDSGVWIDEDSSNVVVVNNAIRDNSRDWASAGGIYVRCVDTVTVYNNGFYGNEAPQAYDWYESGCWSQDPPIGGNYWDDYAAVVGHAGVNVDDYPDFWDDPYPIGSISEDAYPLVNDDVVIPEFSTLVVPVLLVLAVFLISRRRSSAK